MKRNTTGATKSGISLAALALLLIFPGCARRFDNLRELAKYDIVWDRAGHGSKDSMPAGNGDLSLNVWTEEETGSVCFYIGKTDAWDDSGRLLKVGKVRVKVEPNPFGGGRKFSQRLSLADAAIEVTAGEGRDEATIRVWADANRPVVHVEARVPPPSVVTAAIEPWRLEPEVLKDELVSGLNHWRDLFGPTVVRPDVVLEDRGKDRLVWYHANVETPSFAKAIAMQGLENAGIEDPLKDRVFGGLVEGEGFVRAGKTSLTNDGGAVRRLNVHVLTSWPATPDRWLRAIEESQARAAAVSASTAWAAHRAHWREFWNRSWIYVATAPGAAVKTPLGDERRGLRRHPRLRPPALHQRVRRPGGLPDQVQRVALHGRRGGGRGLRRLPPLGARLLVAEHAASLHVHAGLRRLRPHAALLRDVFGPAAARRVSDQALLRARRGLLPRVHQFLGHRLSRDVGGQVPGRHARAHPDERLSQVRVGRRPGDGRDDARVLLLHARRGLLARQGPAVRGGHADLLRRALQDRSRRPPRHDPVPGPRDLVDMHEPHARAGRPVLASSRPRSRCPPDLLPDDYKSLLARLEPKLPPLPTREIDGVRLLAPAERFADKRNVENPELYAVYPFRLYGLGKPDIELAVRALDRREDRGHFGWRQDDLFMALLGLADQAGRGLVERASKWDARHRFPAFWGPNYDWTPDQDHGGVLMKTLQVMLLQAEDRDIRLLPAWPAGWDADFKLHAPDNTVVAGRVRGGKLVELDVTPKSRRADVISQKDN